MSTSTTDQAASADKRTLTVALVLGILGLVGISVIIYFVWKMKNPTKKDKGHNETTLPTANKAGYAFSGFGPQQTGYYQGKTIQDEAHPAARITPFSFGANGDGPVFDHEPGQNMRIASRKSNGLWAFHDVDPATGSPLGIDDPTPSPSSPYSTQPPGSPSSFSWEPRGYSSLRSGDSSSIRTGASGRKRSVGNYLDYFGEVSPMTPPPAAYGAATIPSPSTTTTTSPFPHRDNTADR